MFLKYSTSQNPPKKSIGKGSQGKKTVDTPVVDVDVSEESDSEPARKRTASRRVVKKKVTISAADNIIPDPNVALELGKSISLTEVAEEEAARQVHATHARIVIESVPEPARRRPSEQEATNIMQALKESKKTNRRQPSTIGSSERTGVSPGVPDEEKVTSEENVILKWGSKQESEYSKEDQGDDEDVDWIDSDDDEEKKNDTDDDKSIDLEMIDDEETDDEFVHGNEQVNDDEDEEITNAEVEESGNSDEENTDAENTDAGKTEEVKDDAKKAKFPLTSSRLSVSSGYGDQFLKLLFDTSLIGTVKDTTDAEINSLLDIKIQSKVPHIQSPPVLIVPVLVIFEPSVLTPIPVTPSVAPATILLTPSSISTIPPVPHQTTAPIPTPPIITDAPTITTVVPESDALTTVQLRVAKLEKDVSELKKIDLSTKALATLKSQVPTPALESSKIQTPTINLKHSASEIRKIKKEQAENQMMSKYTIKSTNKVALKEHDQKSALYQTIYENNSFNRNPVNRALYHALIEALIEDENAMDKGVVDTGKKTKKRRTKELESSKKPSTNKETPKGKAPSKGSKTGKSASTKEPVEELIVEVAMDDAVNIVGEDVVRDDDQPQDTSEPKTYKTLNQDWFKQPPRPPTPDLEWNKRQVVLDQPEEPWFNQMVSATKDPLTFNDLMATPIDFSKENVHYIDHEDKSSSKILGVKSVSVKKLHGYGHLEEVIVKRADRQLYKFKEGDFVDLHLNDIEDMLLLVVQHKLFHLNDSDIVDFIMALRMLTRSLIIKRLVEDL
ncbi:retrovirus-related pol polyprotein from transposon TNT 1-94 [Tanacetum coccineum]